MTFKRKNNSYRVTSVYDKILSAIALSVCVPLLYAGEMPKGQDHGDKPVVETSHHGAGASGIHHHSELAVTEPTAVESGLLQLRAEQWELARSGERILSLPELNQLVNKWLIDRDKIIEIRYPGGEEGEFWVQELTDWMVSLGIPSSRMVTVPGSGVEDVIKFALVK
ncbi:MAG TPA: hypothetical protein ENJ87_06855 [Gammaproteobacteria bacterium]|nr:hypothetical protein [Gammaproteobacteria bacterium]